MQSLNRKNNGDFANTEDAIDATTRPLSDSLADGVQQDSLPNGVGKSAVVAAGQLPADADGEIAADAFGDDVESRGYGLIAMMMTPDAEATGKSRPVAAELAVAASSSLDVESSEVVDLSADREPLDPAETTGIEEGESQGAQADAAWWDSPKDFVATSVAMSSASFGALPAEVEQTEVVTDEDGSGPEVKSVGGTASDTALKTGSSPADATGSRESDTSDAETDVKLSAVDHDPSTIAIPAPLTRSENAESPPRFFSWRAELKPEQGAADETGGLEKSTVAEDAVETHTVRSTAAQDAAEPHTVAMRPCELSPVGSKETQTVIASGVEQSTSGVTSSTLADVWVHQGRVSVGVEHPPGSGATSQGGESVPPGSSMACPSGSPLPPGDPSSGSLEELVDAEGNGVGNDDERRTDESAAAAEPLQPKTIRSPTVTSLIDIFSGNMSAGDRNRVVCEATGTGIPGVTASSEGHIGATEEYSSRVPSIESESHLAAETATPAPTTSHPERTLHRSTAVVVEDAQAEAAEGEGMSRDLLLPGAELPSEESEIFGEESSESHGAVHQMIAEAEATLGKGFDDGSQSSAAVSALVEKPSTGDKETKLHPALHRATAVGLEEAEEAGEGIGESSNLAMAASSVGNSDADEDAAVRTIAPEPQSPPDLSSLSQVEFAGAEALAEEATTKESAAIVLFPSDTAAVARPHPVLHRASALGVDEAEASGKGDGGTGFPPSVKSTAEQSEIVVEEATLSSPIPQSALHRAPAMGEEEAEKEAARDAISGDRLRSSEAAVDAEQSEAVGDVASALEPLPKLLRRARAAGVKAAEIQGGGKEDGHRKLPSSKEASAVGQSTTVDDGREEQDHQTASLSTAGAVSVAEASNAGQTEEFQASLEFAETTSAFPTPAVATGSTSRDSDSTAAEASASQAKLPTNGSSLTAGTPSMSGGGRAVGASGRRIGELGLNAFTPHDSNTADPWPSPERGCSVAITVEEAAALMGSSNGIAGFTSGSSWATTAASTAAEPERVGSGVTSSPAAGAGGGRDTTNDWTWSLCENLNTWDSAEGRPASTITAATMGVRAAASGLGPFASGGDVFLSSCSPPEDLSLRCARGGADERRVSTDREPLSEVVVDSTTAAVAGVGRTAINENQSREQAAAGDPSVAKKRPDIPTTDDTRPGRTVGNLLASGVRDPASRSKPKPGKKSTEGASKSDDAASAIPEVRNNVGVAIPARPSVSDTVDVSNNRAVQVVGPTEEEGQDAMEMGGATGSGQRTEPSKEGGFSDTGRNTTNKLDTFSGAVPGNFTANTTTTGSVVGGNSSNAHGDSGGPASGSDDRPPGGSCSGGGCCVLS